MQNNNIPKIRFNGFTAPWEQRKLANVVDSVDTGKSKFDKEGSSGEYPILGSTSVIGYDEEYDYEGDFILTARVGANAGSLYRHAGKVKISDNTVFIQASQNIEFLYQLLIQFDIKKLSFGTGQPLVKASELKSLELMMPTDMKEQMQIGAYFSELDNLIALHQRKYDKLTNVKKSMLEKLFPKNGASVPKIRFKGFSDAWEQRKVGEVGSVSMCRRIFKEQTSESGDIPFYKIGTFGGQADAYISSELFAEYRSKYPYPKEGDILISASGSIGRTVEFTGKNEYFQDSNIVWLSHDDRLNNTFLKCFYSVVKWAGIEGSTIKRLYNDNILNTVISMPSVAEQKRIGTFFKELDNLITLHQCKLEKLKHIKQACLEQMFL